MSVTFAKMQKALISAELTFTSWNPPVEPNHNKGMFWNKNTNTYFMKEQISKKEAGKKNKREKKKIF